MSASVQPVYEFDGFRLDPTSRLLQRGGAVVPLKPKVFDTLLALVEAGGRLLTKEQLMRAVWPDTAVEENNLTQNVSALRKVFGEQRDEHRYIVTVPGHGYRFVAPVKVAGAEAPRRTRRVPFLIVAAVCLVLALAVGGYQLSRRTRTTGASGRVMLAVLPLQNLSGDSGEEFFSDGLTEEMITQLGRLQPDRLGVIARTTTMQYKSTTKAAGQIGRELGVDYILEGSVRRGNDQVRISAQLIRVSDQTHLWADSYQRDARDILAVQSQVANDIAREISIKLTQPSHSALASAHPVNPKAHELYLRARYLWNRRTEDGLRNSIGVFQQAIDADPSYAPSYAGLADAYIASGNWGFIAPSDAYPRAKSAAAKALEIDQDSADARVALAYATYLYDRNPVQAEREFQRALQLNPSYAVGHQWYAVLLASRGRFAEAIDHIERAQRLDPLSLIINNVVGWIYELARRYDRAAEEFHKGLELDPNFYPSRCDLAMTDAAMGRYDEALSELERAQAASGDTERIMSALAYVYALKGDKARASSVLATLLAAPKLRYVPPYDLAIVYGALGEKELAFNSLERAYQQRDPSLMMVRVDPALDSLRSDPRFAELVRRVGV